METEIVLLSPSERETEPLLVVKEIPAGIDDQTSEASRELVPSFSISKEKFSDEPGSSIMPVV